jgi:hypothetical protein
MTKPQTHTSRIETIGKWIVLATGICYATGFLVVYTFQGHFASRDHGTDLLRLKYIYVGILCWLFPAGFFLPLGGLHELHRTLKKQVPDHYRKKFEILISIFFVLFVPVVVYFMVEFARPEKTLPPWWIALSMGAAFPGFWIFDTIRSERLRKFLRYSTALIVSLSFFWIGRYFILFVLDIVFRKNGYLYIVFVISAISVFPRNRTWTKKLPPDVSRHAWIMAICLSILLMYLAALAYAAWVYPYVPATRGGGDFTVMADVRISLRDEKVLNLPASLGTTSQTDYFRTARFKVIDSTPDTLFLADVNSGNGPPAWREWPVDTRRLANVPFIIEIPTSEVSSVVYCRDSACIPH